MKKRIIQAVIFISGIFLFAVALTPRYFNDQPDSRGVDSPSVIKDADEYRMYYTGYYLGSASGGPGSIHLATSKDGFKWEKIKGNPLIKPGRFTSVDSASVYKPVVIKDKEGYKCFYFGEDGNGNRSICLATSETGYGWRKYDKNPVFTKERPVPTSEEVKGWSNEQIDAYLSTLNFPADFPSINPVIWLEQFARILQEGNSPAFFKHERINAMVLMAQVMPDVIKMDFSWSDFDGLRGKIEEMAGNAGEIPPWVSIRMMQIEEVNSLINKLGISDSAFKPDKKESLIKLLEFIEGKTGSEMSLRYLKVIYPAAFSSTRKDLPFLKESVRKLFSNGGFEGLELIDFSILYDEVSNIYRMWYVGKMQFIGEQPSTYLGCAESADGRSWERKSGKCAKGVVLDFKSVKAVSVTQGDDGRFKMAISGKPPEDAGIEQSDVYILESSDGFEWKVMSGIKIRTENGEADFDDGGIHALYLTNIDGKYCLYYSGSLNEWDKPFPSREEIEKMDAGNLYRYAEMVGFRMSRNRQYVVENLSYAKTAIEEPEKLSFLPDETIRNLALYYRLEFDLTGEDLAKIDPELLIFAIRKSFLNRTFTQYGKAIYYPSVKEIDEMGHEELVENSGKYGIKSNTGVEPTDDSMRNALKTFSVLCDGKKDELKKYTQDDLIKIISDYGLSVKIEAVRDLPKEVVNIPRKTLQDKLSSTLKDRRNSFVEQQRVVKRIGMTTSDDLKTWERYKGDRVAGSIVTNDPRGYENPLIKAETEFNKIIIILGWFAVGLGLINLSRHHGLNIMKRGKNYMMSVSFFVAFIVSIIIMPIYYPYYSRFVQVPNPYKFIQNFVAEPIIACILGLLGYYITSAAYRAFRVKNAEAGMMMLIAVLCMLGNISIFEPISRRLFLHTAFDRLHFPYIREWLMGSANAAVFRGLNFGISIGVAAMSIRIILGLEKGAFFEKL